MQYIFKYILIFINRNFIKQVDSEVLEDFIHSHVYVW